MYTIPVPEILDEPGTTIPIPGLSAENDITLYYFGAAGDQFVLELSPDGTADHWVSLPPITGSSQLVMLLPRFDAGYVRCTRLAGTTPAGLILLGSAAAACIGNPTNVVTSHNSWTQEVLPLIRTVDDQ